MSYQLNKTDGTILTNLIDGRIDTNSTNLALVGRGYRGYGEIFNENFIKLLENFSNTAAPSNPLSGQLWWDSANEKLKLYTGTQWKSTGEPFIQPTQPAEIAAGDFWFNSRDNQLYFSEGVGDPILIGPGFTPAQGKSGLFVENILAVDGASYPVIKLFIANEEVGLFSNREIVPTITERIDSLVSAENPDGIIFEGFNVYEKNNFKFIGIAEATSKLAATDGTLLTADQFVRSDRNSLTLGRLEIRNTNGLTFSTTDRTYVNMRPQGTDFYIENNLINSDLRFRVVSGAAQGQVVDAIRIDASEGRMGFFNINRLPQYTFDFDGDMRITGNLIVEGEQLSVEVTELQVLDKNIKLAVSADGTAGDDTIADGGGIILRSNEGDKTVQWFASTNAWTLNRDLNILSTDAELKINGSTKLTETQLRNISSAPELESIGTLQSLSVDFINIDNNVIRSISSMILRSIGGITIDASSDITLTTQQKIRNVSDPELAKDVANRSYVDNGILQSPIVLSFDVTGIDTSVNYLNTLAGYIEDLFPAGNDNVGKIARIHATSYSSVTINIDGAKNISTVAVDANGTLNQPVVRDIAFNNIQFTNPNRQLIEYKVEQYTNPGTGVTAPAWIHQITTQY